VSDISAYLQALRQALAGSDPALIQDALSETEAQFRAERERLAWSEPLLSAPDALARVLAALGEPAARAETYRLRERVVAEALGPVPRAPEAEGEEPPVRPWPSFFGVFLDPKAYTSLLYLLASLITGILYFTWAVTGLSMSLGFLILIIGIPMFILYLGSIRALGLGEGRLVEALLDVRMPRRPPLLPEGRQWTDRLKGLFVDAYTWKCLVYFLIHLPLAILSFTLIICGLSISISLIGAPVANWLWHVPVAVCFDREFYAPVWLLAIMPLGGILGLAGTLHLGLGLGRLHGGLARALLVRR
jgi:hypothetical protein